MTMGTDPLDSVNTRHMVFGITGGWDTHLDQLPLLRLTPKGISGICKASVQCLDLQIIMQLCLGVMCANSYTTVRMQPMGIF